MVESACSAQSVASCWMRTVRPQRNPWQPALLAALSHSREGCRGSRGSCSRSQGGRGARGDSASRSRAARSQCTRGGGGGRGR
eukprot:7384596-Prymnesium_polylepis.1